MSTFTAYLPAIEEGLLDQLVERTQLPRNRLVSVAIRGLYVYAARHGFDHLEEKIATEAKLAAGEGSAPVLS